MSMYRREHAGFDYELWLRRGHTGTPDDFLEWLRGPKGDKGDPADPDSIEVDNLTQDARRILEAGYLPIANERIYGSVEVEFNESVQSMTSFVDVNGEIIDPNPPLDEEKKCAAGDEYVVFGTTNSTGYTAAGWLTLYNYTKDRIIKKVNTKTVFNVTGHYNDMTYCPADKCIYVANLTHPTVEVYNMNLTELVGQIDLTAWGDSYDWTKDRQYYESFSQAIKDKLAEDNYYLSQLAGIAWSAKESCFYLRFRGPRNLYRVSAAFEMDKRIEAAFGSMSSQGIYVERETGNIISIKFRSSSSYRYPPGNRLQIYSPEGKLVAVTYTSPSFELESITEMADGHMLFLWYASNIYAAANVPEGDLYNRKHAALFTIGTITPRVGTSLYSTYLKNYLNSSDYRMRTNNIYYREEARGSWGTNGIWETGGNPMAESPGKPFKTWASVMAFIRANHTKNLRIHLLSDINWPVHFACYDRIITFIGESTESVAVLQEDVDTDSVEADESGGSGEENITATLEEVETDVNEGGALRAIKDLYLRENTAYFLFENLALGGRNLKLTRNNRVFFNGCKLYKTDANTVQQGTYATAAFSETQAYAVGDYVIYSNGVSVGLYIRKTAVNPPPGGADWKADDWQYVGNAKHYKGAFDADTDYAKGDYIVHDDDEGEGYLPVYYKAPQDISSGDWDVSLWEKIGNAQMAEDTWGDNNALHFTGCDFSDFGTVDTLRTRLILLKDTTAYGASTRFSNVGGVFRIYNWTTPAEQYVLRGLNCGVANIGCTALTAISQIRMNMQFNVSATDSARFTDLPYYVTGLAFPGRAEVLNNNKMLYVITQGTEEYRRIVTFGSGGTTITEDSGWMTRDNELYPVNTVIRPEARAENWAGKKILLFGDSISTYSHSETYWIDTVAEETGSPVTNRARSGARFATSYNTIRNEMGGYAGAVVDGLDVIAKYRGSWGNGLSYSITANAGAFDVSVTLNGSQVGSFTGVATIGDLKAASENNTYIVFRTAAGYTDSSPLTANAGVTLSDGVDMQPALFNDVGVVIIAAGSNDAANSSIGGQSFRASVQGVIDAIRGQTDAPIIFITPIRRGRDISGGTGTEAYGRLRLVASAICNVAMLNDCSVVNGFGFPIATSGSEWVEDMSYGDGLHPRVQGKKVYAQSFLTAVGAAYKAVRNVFPATYYDGTSKTTSGITFTVNKDGSVRAVGTATANANFFISYDNVSLPDGDYILTGCPPGGGSSTYRLRVADHSLQILAEDSGQGSAFTLDNSTLSDGTLRMYMTVIGGATVNITFRPMMRRASIASSTYYPPQTIAGGALTEGWAESVISAQRDAIDALSARITALGG